MRTDPPDPVLLGARALIEVDFLQLPRGLQAGVVEIRIRRNWDLRVVWFRDGPRRPCLRIVRRQGPGYVTYFFIGGGTQRPKGRSPLFRRTSRSGAGCSGPNTARITSGISPRRPRTRAEVGDSVAQGGLGDRGVVIKENK